ncbi:hypothetical protein A3A74_08155 [Candidatus Roizmanbacteria bacterium RIFCSPLOWO2_01_FULL_35_13]|uniref:Uncharacterized protein n=1 Tax=Candidatus Roizmanbacteria bacterium RIFCSPLOWO2_01_FULL_35_13 TaxID=1802055 RepID=A0A1F7IDY0_9BACT|nr:MAG: hypothetical protein A3A74_08155 [Candidatus Roizmanbacteria bacterium RIFCSPLOWO2_01_FULL_35_13]
MKKMPNSIGEHILNAEYYLEAAGKHLPPTKDAVHILLLLIGWENLVIADEELKAWVKKEDVDEKVYRSHVRKFRDVPEVTRVIIGPTGKAKEVRFSSSRDFEELRMACQYGSNTESKNVKELFKSGWHLDRLRNGLISKIGWMKVIISAYEELEKEGAGT